MTAEIDLSIIIPAYMEAARIGATLEQLAAWLDTASYGEVEVLVVVADSPDGTARLAAAMAPRFKHFRLITAGPRVGKGRDVRLGIFEAAGRYRMFMDADLATPLHHLDDVKRFMDNGGAVGIAERDLWKIHEGLARKVISKSGNLVTQLVLLPGIIDSQCGFKAFEAGTALELFGRMTMLGWSFDAELLFIARKLRIPVTGFKAPDWRDPKPAELGLAGDNPIRAGLASFVDLLIIRWRSLSGAYRTVSYKHQSRY